MSFNFSQSELVLLSVALVASLTAITLWWQGYTGQFTDSTQGKTKTLSVTSRDWFLIVVGFAAFSMAAYKVSSVDGWRHWMIMIGLEALRAALVMSNIGIRKIDKNLSYFALFLSIVATMGLAFMSHFHVAEGLGGDTNPMHTSEWWTLQTINALLLFCEWSMSVLIAGHLLNWEALTEWIEGGFKTYFDTSTIDSRIEPYISRITKTGKTLVSDLQKVGKELGLEEEAGVEDILTAIGQLKAREAQWKDDAEKLRLDNETFLLKVLALEKSKYMVIGKKTANRVLSIGNNQYEVHCSGRDDQDKACETFTMQKSQASKACPTCGKTHYRNAPKVNGSSVKDSVTKN